MTPQTEQIVIREFAEGDEAAFRELNEEWIERYFVLEAKDRASLADPRKTILDRGGRVFLAFREDRAVGCCALLAMSAGEYEVAKMAVTASAQGAGIGRRLLRATIDAARDMGARRLYLETNSGLSPAIHLYHALGFRPVPPERIVPSPYARANVYLELFF